MTSGFSLIILLTISVLNNAFADDDGHHHHVIIHVPYKIHTIHHTILKHIRHHNKDSGADDKYEVLGYTIGKPIDLSHHLGAPHLHHYEPPLPPPPPPPPLPLHRHEPPPYHPHQHHHPEVAHHHHHHEEFNGGNELGYGHDWEPTFGHEFAGGGYHPSSAAPHYENHAHFGASHEFGGHHEGFGGYD